MEYDKAIKRFGIHCQDYIQRLKIIKIELDGIKSEYKAIGEVAIVEIIDVNLDFMTNLLAKGLTQNQLEQSNFKEDLEKCKLVKIKDFCLREKKFFYR